MQEKIKQYIKESAEAKASVEPLSPAIEQAVNTIIASLQQGNKLLIAGNGGSASQASHFSAELVGRYMKERKGIAALSLSTDTSMLTAWSNDYAFETVFSRQIEALGREGDVFFGISTSGGSANIIKALEEAKAKKMKTLVLLGKDGGKTKGLADVEIIVPNFSTPRIQECHILIIHMICELVEEALS